MHRYYSRVKKPKSKKNKNESRKRPVPMPPPGNTEVERSEQVLASVVAPDPSRGLKRLPFTPRFTPEALERAARAKAKLEELYFPKDEDEDEYEYADEEEYGDEVEESEDEAQDGEEESEEEEIEEDRTIVAPLAHRFTHTAKDIANVRDLLTISFHTIEGNKHLLSCDLLHKDITPREIKAYYRDDGRVIGVLHDLDDRRLSRTEENVILDVLQKRLAAEAAEKRRKEDEYNERQKQKRIAESKRKEEMEQKRKDEMKAAQAA